MNMAVSSPWLVCLAPEWQRLQLLAYCAVLSRQGQEIAGDKIEQLEQLQKQVAQLRVTGAKWHQLLGVELSALEIDILVCVLAPEFEPRLGWAYQSLGGEKSDTYPSRALIQEILALEAHNSQWLFAALNDTGALQKMQLINVKQCSPYEPIYPEPWLVAKLLGTDYARQPPPGTTLVNHQVDWSELVLPKETLIMLQEYLGWIRYRHKVVDEWGGYCVGGPVALFAGPSGTGKTLAASVLATALGWPLFRVDLGRLVSKYIGETEKNLNKLFDAAQGRQMILQFDEADSLFSKRGEVKDARDRYANMEVSHLLSKIENHQGPCILTTNLRKQIDSAFARRFQMVVEFARPDAKARRKLWQVMLPKKAPLADSLDLTLVAKSVSLCGGNIRNAALHACYLAAAQDCEVSMSQIALAVWREVAKEGREVSLRELGALAQYIPEVINGRH